MGSIRSGQPTRSCTRSHYAQLARMVAAGGCILAGAMVTHVPSAAQVPVDARTIVVEGQPPTLRMTLLGQALIRFSLHRESPESAHLMEEMLADADVVFTNLESVIEAHEGLERSGGSLVHNARPEVLPSLRALHVNLLALSNNHSWDLRAEGVLSTIEEVKRHGFVHAGTGRNLAEASAPAFIETEAGRVALVAVASGSLPESSIATSTRPGVNALRLIPELGVDRDQADINAQDAERILREVRAAADSADYVVFYHHNHYFPRGEARHRPGVWFQEWARTVIDAGASVFVAHGNVVTQGIEMYRGRPILYGLGNFVYQNRRPLAFANDPYPWESVVAELQFRDRTLQSLSVRPIILRETVTQPTRESGLFFPAGHPRPAPEQDARRIIERLTQRSAALGTLIVPTESGAAVDLSDAAATASPAAPVPPAPASAPPGARDTLRLSLLGQALIRHGLERESPESAAAMRHMLQAADVVFTNLESTIEARPGMDRTHERLIHNARPEVVASLAAMHVNLLALSNNHSWDLGADGILATIEESRRHGLTHAGTGRNLQEASAPVYLDTPNGRVALVALASGSLRSGSVATTDRPGVNALRMVPEAGTDRETGELNPADVSRILDAVRSAAQHADHVIVYQHNHYYPRGEARHRPGVWFREWARRVIDAGATVFVAHGNPVMNGVEIYRGRPILYGLGNFIFQVRRPVYYTMEPFAWESVVAEVTFAGSCLHSVRFRPITLRESRTWPPVEPGTFYPAGAPRPAHGDEALSILERLTQRSAALGTGLTVSDEVAEVQLPPIPACP
jgi:poly-gamma-glutamate capsule biosynthesis protein CapA/YwtB (metallophosphatase superfamily)